MLEDRILAATTSGVMLNCDEFDRLLERFFDGVILAPTYRHFRVILNNAANVAGSCRSIEDAIELCHSMKQAEVEIPSELCDRIVAGEWHVAGPSICRDDPTSKACFLP